MKCGLTVVSFVPVTVLSTSPSLKVIQCPQSFSNIMHNKLIKKYLNLCNKTNKMHMGNMFNYVLLITKLFRSLLLS